MKPDAWVVCQCGDWTGTTHCGWSGPAAATRLISIVPSHLRSTVRANMNTAGLTAPVRLHVACAQMVIALEPYIAIGSKTSSTIENPHPTVISREVGAVRYLEHIAKLDADEDINPAGDLDKRAPLGAIIAWQDAIASIERIIGLERAGAIYRVERRRHLTTKTLAELGPVS